MTVEVGPAPAERSAVTWASKSWLVVTHAKYFGSPQAVAAFLRPRAARVVTIQLPFVDAADRRASCVEYRDGRRVRLWRSTFNTPPGVFGYALDVLRTLIWGVRLGGTFDVCVAADNLNATSAIVLRKLGRVRAVVFFTIDYVPIRFAGSVLNWIYRMVDVLASTHSDVAWVLTRRVADARRARAIRPNLAPILVVPTGARFSGSFPGAAESGRIAFVGHLLKKQGLQVVIAALPHIIRHLPSCRLVVIGSGPYEPRLRELAQEVGVEPYIEWHGSVPSHLKMQEILSGCAVAVAPYSRVHDTWTYYADPGKVRDYLASELPVILTDLPEVAELIRAEGAGVVVDYSATAFGEAVVGVLADASRLSRMRQAARCLGMAFDWSTVIEDALSRTQDLLG